MKPTSCKSVLSIILLATNAFSIASAADVNSITPCEKKDPELKIIDLNGKFLKNPIIGADETLICAIIPKKDVEAASAKQEIKSDEIKSDVPGSSPAVTVVSSDKEKSGGSTSGDGTTLIDPKLTANLTSSKSDHITDMPPLVQEPKKTQTVGNDNNANQHSPPNTESNSAQNVVVNGGTSSSATGTGTNVDKHTDAKVTADLTSTTPVDNQATVDLTSTKPVDNQVTADLTSTKPVDNQVTADLTSTKPVDNHVIDVHSTKPVIDVASTKPVVDVDSANSSNSSSGSIVVESTAGARNTQENLVPSSTNQPPVINATLDHGVSGNTALSTDKDKYVSNTSALQSPAINLNPSLNANGQTNSANQSTGNDSQVQSQEKIDAAKLASMQTEINAADLENKIKTNETVKKAAEIFKSFIKTN